MNRRNVRPTRQRQILDAAEHLAARQGWMETTFADICREADVSNGVLTYHFKTKNDILFAMLEDVIERLQGRLALLLQMQGLSSADKIAAFIRALSEFGQGERELILVLVQFMSMSMQQPEIAERIHTFFAGLLRQQVEEAREENVRWPDEPEVVVKLLQCLALGLVLDPLFLGLDFPVEQLTSAATAMFLDYLASSKDAAQ